MHHSGKQCFALILLLTGCTRPGAPTRAQSLAFTVPSGWSVTVPEPDATEDMLIRLHDKDGSCRIQFSRSLSTRPLAAVDADMRAAFDKAGHLVTGQPAMSLGGAPSSHFSVAFADDGHGAVHEQVYLVRSGNWLLTLVTIRAAQCKYDFQSILDDFRT